MTDESFRREFDPPEPEEPPTLTGPTVIQYHGQKPVFDPSYLQDYDPKLEEWLMEAHSVLETIRRKATEVWTALLMNLPPAPEGTFWIPVFEPPQFDLANGRGWCVMHAELAQEAVDE